MSLLSLPQLLQALLPKKHQTNQAQIAGIIVKNPIRHIMYQRNLVTLVEVAETEVELVLLEQIMILLSPKKLQMHLLPKKTMLIKKKIVKIEVIKIKDGIREIIKEKVEAAEAEVRGKTSNKVSHKLPQVSTIFERG